MSQYKAGTANVTNGSATVTGSGTLWSANVSAGDSFTIASTGVVYDVAAVNSNTSITLSVAYAGPTVTGAVYAIGTSFTVPDNFPEMSQGDIETATIFTRAMRKIQGKFSSILAGGANANFTAMPQVGGDPVVESGSNADGEWTRWADGTQIVQMRDISIPKTTGYSTTTLTFPQDFTAPPVSTASPNWEAAMGGVGRRAYAVMVSNDTTVGALYLIDLMDGGTAQTGAWSGNKATSIGRWK